MRLCLYHVFELSLLLHQLIVASFFYDFTLVEYVNGMCMVDRREAMGNDECCASLRQAADTFLDDFLSFRIDVRGRFIKNQDRRILRECPRKMCIRDRPKAV